MTTQRRNQWTVIGMGIAAVGTALALSLAVAGCGAEATADSPLAATTAAGPTGAMLAPPTLADLQGTLNLSEDQAQVVRTALARWQEQAQTRSGERRRTGDGPHYAGPVNGPPQGMIDHQPPMMGFLADCSGALTTEQFGSLCGILAQRRDQQRDQLRETRMDRRQDRIHDRHLRRDRSRSGDRMQQRLQDRDRTHRGPGRGGGAGLMAGLELAPEQRQAVHAAMQTAQNTVRELFQAHARGDASAEAVRDGATAAQSELRSALQKSLDAQQMTDFSKALAAGASRMATHRLQRLQNANGADRRLEFLARVLQLDDAQVAAVKSVFDEAQSEQRTLLEGVRDGGTAYADALYQGIQLHDRIHDRIQDRLREDQQDRLDALKQLRNGPRPFRITL